MGEKSSAVSNFERKKVIRAVKTLKTLHETFLAERSKKKQLFEDSDDARIMLQVTLKKIPDLKKVDMIKIPLHRSLVTETTDICLITGDLDKKDRKADIEPTILHYKELLEKHDIKFISEVIPIRQLRTDYKPYEAKRKLVGGYDIFLADEKIVQCLPRILGKDFFQKRKFPQQIDLQRKNLKDHLSKALSKTVLYLKSKGNSCCLDVANLGWTVKEITLNVMAVVDTLAKKLPGSFDNVHSMFLKMHRSEALPIYMSLESGNDVVLPKVTEQEVVEPEEITSLKSTKVKVYMSGNVKLVKDEEYEPSGSESDYETNLLAEQNIEKKKRPRSIKIRKPGKTFKKVKK